MAQGVYYASQCIGFRVMPDQSGRMILIRAHRAKRKLTQRQLADIVGVEQGYISRLERGLQEPGPDVLRRLADALGVSPGALYERNGLEARILALFEQVPADRQEDALAALEHVLRAYSRN
jgi:transcriptional regulator with XRE-family HTH domain